MGRMIASLVFVLAWIGVGIALKDCGLTSRQWETWVVFICMFVAAIAQECIHTEGR